MEKKGVMKRLEQLSFVVLILFALVGSLVTGVVVHEYSHASDFKDVADDEVVCGLVLPKNPSDIFDMGDPLGYFTFSYDADDQDEVDRINKYTEEKAYILTGVPILLACVAIVMVLVERANKNYGD